MKHKFKKKFNLIKCFVKDLSDSKYTIGGTCGLTIVVVGKLSNYVNTLRKGMNPTIEGQTRLFKSLNDKSRKKTLNSNETKRDGLHWIIPAKYIRQSHALSF